MSSLKSIALYFFLMLSFLKSGFTQSIDVSRFSLLDIKAGLTNNQVTEVIQDSFGFIWIATKKGLNRYDGKNFLQFYADSNRNSLPQDEITKMKMLPGNMLAGFTSSGLFLINTKSLISENILIPAGIIKYSYKVNVIMDVEADKEGNIYLLTRSGFYAMNTKRELWYRYDYYTASDARTKAFAFGNSIVKITDEDYILSAISGTFFFNKKKKRMQPVINIEDAFLNSFSTPLQRFRSLYKTNNEAMILRDTLPFLEYFNNEKRFHVPVYLTEKQRLRFNWRSQVNKLNDTLFTICDKETGFYFIYFNRQSQAFRFDPQVRFEKYNCNSILIDLDGRLWVATSKGLFKEKDQDGNIETLSIPATLYHDSTDISFRMVRIIADKIYAGSKEGLFIFNRDDGKAIRRFDFSSLSIQSKNILSMEAINHDSLLIGPNGKLIVFNPKKATYSEASLPGWQPENWVTSLHKDNEGNLFVGVNDEGKIYIRKKGEMFSPRQNHESNPLFRLVVATSMSTDYENNTWLCGHGMSRYNIRKGSFDFMMDSFPAIKIPRKEVKGLSFDKKGNMYFGLAENGLVIYHPSNKTFEQLSRSNGLPDNNISALYLLGNILWIGTPSGLATYNIDTKKLVSFGNLDDEKPETFFTGFNFYYDSIQRKMYVPCNNAILRFDPTTFKNRNTSPTFFVENIRINDDEVIYHPGSRIELEPGRKNLVVNIASINFEDALEEQFYYRFKDKGHWQLVGSQKSFILSNLAEGTHDIQFMLASKTNSWEPKVIELSVYIKPPFWKSTWFIILAGLVLLSAIWLLYKARINRIRQKANIDKQLAELEMKSLHAQMNPHFIFNALNSIKEMIWENDKQNASRYLSKFAQLIRTTLDQSRQTFITVKQCIQHLEQYLEMEKIRFEDFTYSIETDKNMEWDDIRMAPMLVQPLVENAIWHGLKNTGSEKILEIKFYQERKHVVCEIADNGPGINHHPKTTRVGELHRSISISNIHSRLQMLNEKYNMHCSLEFIDKADKNPQAHGTIAILRLSL